MVVNVNKTPVLFFVLIATLSLGCSFESLARNRIVLSNSKAIASQIKVSDKGAMYVVSEAIDLKNKTVKLPQDAILKFEGGLFSNGELSGNNTTIEAGKYELFRSVTLSGTWIVDGLPVEWFGAVPNRSGSDCSSAINKAVVTGKRISAPALLGSGIYYTKSTIDIPENGVVIGLSPSLTTICYYGSCDAGVFMHGQYTTLKNVCVQEYNQTKTGICIKLGDMKTKVSCTRGFVEDVKTIGGNRGLDLEYQWCNKINGINCRYNNIGLYSNETTPYIENAVIEGNYECGVYSEGAGIKLYNAIIEGNKVGCVLNGRDNMLVNCYFEGNTASYINKSSLKDRNGVDVEGGHIYVGQQQTVNNVVLISCLIGDAKKDNNTVCIDKCLSFTAMGCNSTKNFVLTKNCSIKYIDDKRYTIKK